ncbi:kinase [Bacillus haikouensis]|uniref:kinase n=1 Tax=Bacillus haikouensis TaxID=1510468 RepID=UPI001FE91431|nr:kinase [Bacillus haikouensis]
MKLSMLENNEGSEDVNQVTEALLTHYHSKPSKKSRLIAGIDGLGGAGKTTFAEKLRYELKLANCQASILHIDDCIVERRERYGTGKEEWYEYYFLQWNIEFLQKGLFQKLHQNFDSLTFPFYDHQSGSITEKTINLAYHAIILIEGVFLQREEWRDFFDYMIYIDCPNEMREERVLGRDVYLGDYQARLDKYRRRYWEAEEYYINEVNPISHADYVVRV